LKKNVNTFVKSLLLLTLLCLTLTGCGSKGEKAPTSLELVDLMGNGINLGNTMEAYGHTSLGVTADVSNYETYWGQPVTTPEMINSMKTAGFDSLRIPVAWTNAMDFESGDYTINEAYLNRVEEIIKYAIDADMYVIVNDHWDGGWWGMFGSATPETRDKAMEIYISMWTQIADKYKDYSNKLIFESANEELGNRLNDVDLCPDSGSLSEDECYEMTNKINQTFVDTIRKSGGKNENRFLLIAGYNTDITKTCDERYAMPTDTAKDKLLISVHYYTPSGYCINTSLSSWGSEKNYTEQNNLLAMMKKFTDQGYGVVIGEYAVALNEDGSIKNDTLDYFANFLNNCDLYGYVPMLWDCSSLFIRTDLAFFDQGVADFFKNRSFSAQATKSKEEIATEAQTSMDAAIAVAKEEDAKIAAANAIPEDQALAWIMYNSSDWSVLYSAGDVYDPVTKTEGIIATDVPVTGEGTYTVSLDFTGTGTGFANSAIFSAIGIANGELLFPDYVINIKEVLVNGEPYALNGKPYTTSDDKKCTRLNLVNEWVTSIPKEARTLDGNLNGASPTVLDPATLGNVETLTITFDYGPAK
jgi:endoglucanase